MRNLLFSLSFIKRHATSSVKSLVILTAVAGFFWFIVESSFIYVIQGLLLSLNLLKSDASFLPEFYPKDFKNNLILLIAFGAIRSFAAFLKTYITGQAANLFTTTMRERIAGLVFSHVELMNTSKVVDVLNDKALRAGYLVEQFCGVLTTGTVIALLSIGCLYLSTPLFLIGIVVMGFLAAPVKFLDKKISEIGHHHISSYTDINVTILNTLKNRFFLRIYNLVDVEKLKVLSSIDRYRHYSRIFVLISSVKTGVPLLAGSVAIGFIAYSGSKILMNDGLKLLSFIYLFIRFSQTFSEFLTCASNLQLGYHNVLQMEEFISDLNNVKPFDTHPTMALKESPASISGDNVHFSYDDKEVIKSLNFNWEIGDVVLIQGESGSGKSTLISLLLGYLQPSKGSIKINGIPVFQCKNDLTKWISYVGPDPYLITGTIEQNVTYGMHSGPGISLNEALKLAKVDFLNDDLLSGKKILNETVPLSTGQKQRISIARAFYRNPKLMIFDEGTANLDEITERHVIDSLLKFKKDRIIILISHKTNFTSIADKVIKFEKN